MCSHGPAFLMRWFRAPPLLKRKTLHSLAENKDTCNNCVLRNRCEMVVIVTQQAVGDNHLMRVANIYLPIVFHYATSIKWWVL